MVTTVASASSAHPTISQRWWFQFLARAVLALLALGALAFANDRYAEFLNGVNANLLDGTRAVEAGMWWAWMALTIAAGFLFGLAAWLPFTRVRFLWSRLLLAGLALIPIVQVWWLLIEGHRNEGGWLYDADWLVDPLTQSALAVLVGVAIASGFREARATGEAP